MMVLPSFFNVIYRNTTTIQKETSGARMKFVQTDRLLLFVSAKLLMAVTTPMIIKINFRQDRAKNARIHYRDFQSR